MHKLRNTAGWLSSTPLPSFSLLPQREGLISLSMFAASEQEKRDEPTFQVHCFQRVPVCNTERQHMHDPKWPKRGGLLGARPLFKGGHSCLNRFLPAGKSLRTRIYNPITVRTHRLIASKLSVVYSDRAVARQPGLQENIHAYYRCQDHSHTNHSLPSHFTKSNTFRSKGQDEGMRGGCVFTATNVPFF